MAEWIFRREQGCCAWLGRGPGKRSERRSRHKAIGPNGMRSFWKVAAFRLTESIRILSVRRALRCFQNELHHFIILNLKWYYFDMLEGLDLEIAEAGREVIRSTDLDDLLRHSPAPLLRVFLDEPIEVHVLEFRDPSRNLEYRSASWDASVLSDWDDMMDPVSVTLSEEKWRVGWVTEEGKSAVVATRSSTVSEEMFDLAGEFLLALPWAMLVTGFGGWWISRFALGPIETIIAKAEEVTFDGSEEPIPVTCNHEELQRLTSVLNAMISRLKRSYVQATRFSADASHELKTPLTVIQGELDSAIKSHEFSDDQNRNLLRMQEQIERLKRIIESLLILSRSDLGNLGLDMRLFDLAPALREMIDDCEILGRRLKIRFCTNLPGKAEIVGDETLIRQAIFNVLSNAIKFNRLNGYCECRLTVVDSKIEITVRNSGSPIDPDEAERIFDRFFKGRVTARGNGPRYGLGLSLTREIIKSHGGEVELIHSDSSFTEFRLSIPIGDRT